MNKSPLLLVLLFFLTLNLGGSQFFPVADSRLYSIELYQDRNLKWEIQYNNRDKSKGTDLIQIEIINKLNFDARLFTSVYEIKDYLRIEQGSVEKDLFNYLIIANLLYYDNGTYKNFFDLAASGITYDDEGNYTISNGIPKYIFLKNYGETLLNISIDYDYSSGIATELSYIDIYQGNIVESYHATFDNSFNFKDFYRINSILRPGFTNFVISTVIVFVIAIPTVIYLKKRKS